jgi:hypothetical protein
MGWSEGGEELVTAEGAEKIRGERRKAVVPNFS